MQSGDQWAYRRATSDHDRKTRLEHRLYPTIYGDPGEIFGCVESNKGDDAENANDYVTE